MCVHILLYNVVIFCCIVYYTEQEAAKSLQQVKQKMIDF